MRTIHTLSAIEQPLFWQALAALALAGALLAIPAPVAAEPAKEPHALHPVSPAIQGLLIQPRPVGQTPRPAQSAKEKKSASRLNPLRKQLKGLPQHNLQAARQEAAFSRRMLTTRSLLADHPQPPRFLQGLQIRSIDGDTFAVGAERFRLRGITTPKPTEAGGLGASQRLDLLLHEGPEVLVIPYGQDSHGHTLAEVFVNNRNVAEVMKEEGYDKQR